MSDAQHTDALARAMEAHDGEPPTDDERETLAWVLDSTDPEVHAALLDALTRHGVLREEQNSPGYYKPIKRRLVTRWEPTP